MLNEDYGNGVTIHPGHINAYKIFPPRRYLPPDPDQDPAQSIKSTGQSARPLQLQDNFHHGKLSAMARRKMLNAFDYMFLLSKKNCRKLIVITVTLSSKQIHTDHEISVSCLSPLLKSLQRRFKTSIYFWRAEKQANGNLHYHIIIDQFIPHEALREMWNNYQNRLGYVDRYRRNRLFFHSKGFRYDASDSKKRSLPVQLKAYHDGVRTDWYNPNSTDVHGMHGIRSTRAYLGAYLKKTDQTAGLTCRIWGCSENLEGITGAKHYLYSKLEQELSLLSKEKWCWYRKADYFEVFYFQPGMITQLNYPEIYECLQLYLQQKFPDIVHPELTPQVAA